MRNRPVRNTIHPHGAICVALCVGALLGQGCYSSKPIDSAYRAQAALAAIDPPPSMHDTVETGGTLTLDAALELARRRDRQIAASEMAVRASEAAVSDASAWENPEVRIRTRRFDDYVDGQTGVGFILRAPIPMPGSLAAHEAQASAALRADRAAIVERRTLSDAATRRLFREVQLLRLESAAADDELDSLRALQSALQVEVDAGRNTALAFLRHDLEVSQAQAEYKAKRRQLDNALSMLAARIGRERVLEHEVASALPRPGADPLLAQLRQEEAAWGEADPAIERAAAAIDAASARSWLEESEAWPWFRFVQIGYDLESGAPAGEAWTAQVAVSIPIFSLNRSGIEGARAERLRAELVFDATVMARKASLDHSAVAFESAAAEWRDLVEGPLRAAEAALDEAARAKSGGGASMAEALAVEVKAAAARRRETAALRRYFEARMALIQKLGRDDL